MAVTGIEACDRLALRRLSATAVSRGCLQPIWLTHSLGSVPRSVSV